METIIEKKPVSLGKGWDSEVKITRVHFYTKVPDTELLETVKYQYFKLDEKNRPIHEEKVNSFMKLFKNGKCFMREFPCIVSKDLTIIDGQHRFEAVLPSKTRRMHVKCFTVPSRLPSADFSEQRILFSLFVKARLKSQPECKC